MITAPGLYPELSETYHSIQHAPTRALTQSGIKILLNETPFDYMNPPEKKSAEMAFGSVVHTLALGKGARFSVSPFDDYKTKDARQWRDDTNAEGLIPIKAEPFQNAQKIATIIKNKIDRVTQGEHYETEVPFFWQEGETWCSGMLDIWCPALLFGADIKITSILGKRLRAHVVNQGWDLQNAWYTRGLAKIMPEYAGRIRFGNILVHPKPPHNSRLTMINTGWRDSAEDECLRALTIFGKCMETNTWPGYPDDFEMLDIPAWTLKERIENGMMMEDE